MVDVCCMASALQSILRAHPTMANRASCPWRESITVAGPWKTVNAQMVCESMVCGEASDLGIGLSSSSHVFSCLLDPIGLYWPIGLEMSSFI